MSGVFSRILAASVVSALCACAATQSTRKLEPSGFLANYAQLRPGRVDESLLVYIDRDADFSGYDSVLVEPVTIWHGGADALADVPPQELEHLAQHLESALRKQLGSDFEIVDKAGQGVLRVRAAITAAEGSKVALDIATTLLFPIDAVAMLATGSHAFVGRAAIEVEVLDGATNRRLAAAVDERAGRKSFDGSSSTWSDVEAAFDYWAERLSIRLATLRALDQNLPSS